MSRSALGRALLGLYPWGWRARYEQEMAALIDDDPPSLRGLASLVSGAVAAYARPRAPWARPAPAQVRMRASVGFVFACWIAMSLAGATFQWTTEDRPFLEAGDHHTLLSAARDVIMGGAALGALAVAVGGLPLLWQALTRAVRARDRTLLGLIALPAATLAGAWCAAVVLGLLAPARDGRFPLGFVLAAGVPWVALALAAAAGCALVPLAVMRRAEPAGPVLRRASRAGIVLVLAMATVSAGIAIYAVALFGDASALAAGPSGPVGASVRAMLLASLCVAVICTAAGALGATRAMRAASSPPS